jgi:hypothetical protein
MDDVDFLSLQSDDSLLVWLLIRLGADRYFCTGPLLTAK